MKKIKISGHRGYRAKDIENTEKAFLRAIKEKLGYVELDYVELDVRKTKDNRLVIFHDRKTDRLLNSKGKLSKFKLRQLKMLKYEDGQHILTLEELLEIAKNKIGLIIDVKAKSIEKDLINEIQKFEMNDQLILQSHSGKLIKRLYDIAPGIRYSIYRTFIGKYLRPHRLFTHILFKKIVGKYPVEYLSLNGPFIYDKFLSIAHKNNMKIILGALRTEKYLNKVKDWKIEIINADDPAKIRTLLESI